jgi:hypothetical protein
MDSQTASDLATSAQAVLDGWKETGSPSDVHFRAALRSLLESLRKDFPGLPS